MDTMTTNDEPPAAGGSKRMLGLAPGAGRSVHSMSTLDAIMKEEAGEAGDLTDTEKEAVATKMKALHDGDGRPAPCPVVHCG